MDRKHRKTSSENAEGFFRDSGIFHSLLGIGDEEALNVHPKLGASWEGFALEEVIRSLGVGPEQVFFWATHNEAELDLLVFKHGKRIGYEIKHTSTPRLTPSMRIAQENLRLDHLSVVYPGADSFTIGPNVQAMSLQQAIQANLKS